MNAREQYRRHWFGASLLVMASLTTAVATTAVARADDNILARGWTHETYGRLVLDTGTAELSDVKTNGNVMVITFKRPVAVDMGAAIGNLQPYISGATPSADNRQLVLRLKQAVSFRQFDDNGNLVIDLGVPAPVLNKQAAQAETLPTAAVGKPAPLATIQPRAGEHSSYGRIAFDLPETVGFSLRQDGNRLTLQLTGGNLDLAKLQRDLPPRLQAALAQSDPSGQRVTFALKPGVELRNQQQGRTVILDLYDQGKAPKNSKAAPLNVAASKGTAAAGSATSASAATTASPAATTSPAATAVAAPTPETSAPKSTDASLFQGLVPISALPGRSPSTQAAAGATPSASQGQQVAGGTAPAPVAAAPVALSVAATPVPSQPTAQAEQPATLPSPVDVPVIVAPQAGGGAIITFQWPKPVELAAFKRGDSLWLVFDAPAGFGTQAFGSPLLGALGRVDPVTDRFASGLRLSGGALPVPTIHSSGNTWVIDLKTAQQGGAAKTIQQRRETLAQGGASLLLEAANPGAVLTLTDPTIGDQLKVVGLRDAGLGVSEQAVWPEFKLLPSYQGIVVSPLADNVAVQPLPNGVVVTTVPASKPPAVANGADGNSATPATAAKQTQPTTTTTAPSGTDAASIGVAGLFDLPAWRRGGQATFLKDRDLLEEEITKSSPSGRNAARLDLAEFLFANGLVPEAAGMLDLIASDSGPLQMSNKGFLTLRAAAHALKGDDDQAAKLLADPQVGNSPEASLFRGVLAARKGDAAGAAVLFDEPLPVLKDYPKSLRTDLGLLIARALIEGGNPMQAQVYTDAIRRDMPNAENTDRIAYLEGLRQLKMGQQDAAFQTWAGLKNSAVEDVRADSQYAVIMEKLRTKQMTQADAIGPLEELRFLARGGDFEFHLLRSLGEAYLAAGQPRKGLLTLRQAVTNFPNRPDIKDVAQEMGDAFEHLYLGGGADALSPMTAVALYDEFRELTPSGEAGDRMIAALSDRLVKVDLLDGAAKLLDGQVKHRLSGIDKARAGTRLAAIYLLDNKPDMASQALKDSQVGDQLPDDLAALRGRLQSQADFGAGQTLKALDEIKNDDSLPARWQRADMLWQLQEWPAASDALGQVIDGEEQALAQQAAQVMAHNNVAIDPAAALRDAGASGNAAPAANAQPANAAATPLAAGATYADTLAKVRADAFQSRLAKVVLNRAVALSLANDRAGLHKLARDYGKDMSGTNLAHTFDMLTSPGNGLAESVTAEMSSIDQISSFVDEYKNLMRQASLSSPSLTN